MKKLFLIIIFLALNGCMTAQEAAMKFDSQPASKICYDYYGTPDYNIWKSDRAASIRRRGIDCSPYIAKAQRDLRITQGLIGLGQALSTPTTTTSTSTNMGFTKVCYYDGVGGPAALTVRSTSICPITYSHNISGFTKICHYPNAMGGPKAITVKSPSICPLRYPG
jgi:hypothetical protein